MRLYTIMSAASAVVLAVCGMTAGAQAQFVALDVAGNPTGDALVRPIGVYSAPGDYRRIFVVQKGGQIRSIDISQNPPVTQPSSAPFLNLGALVQTPVNGGDERGLLGLAFHPQFQMNGKFYVYYTNPAVSGLPTGMGYYQNIMEYTLTSPAATDTTGATVRAVMRIQHPTATNHNGGSIRFGPDGYLYICTGDGGLSGDSGTGHNATIGNAQDTGLPLGKILRIDVNTNGPAPQGPFWSGTATPGVANYGIPGDNPTLPVVSGGTSPARQEIWAYGVRNPWRCTFDRLTGDLWIADVGQDLWEEINFQPARTLAPDNLSAISGRNYGWRCFEGTLQFNISAGNPQTNGGRCPATYNDAVLTAPVGVYPHSTAAGTSGAPRSLIDTTTGNFWTGCSITGGYVYRGCRIPSLYGKYVFADYCGGVVYSTTLNTGTGLLNNPTSTPVYVGSTAVTPNVPAYTTGLTNNTVSFGEDSYGELYMVSQGTGRIYKFVSTAAGTIPLANADYDRNGVLAVSDIFTYLGDWFSGVTRADYNRDGVLSVQDIFDFLSGWFGGCAG